jgi:NAD(P)-dependent dehydrogenase (short-subunit alcohol dehydrogenase family)
MKAVLITGGGKRIGAVLAGGFAAAGWHVVNHHRRSQAEAEALASDLPSAEVVQAELDGWEAGPAVIRSVADRLSDWRVLINCASVFRFDSAEALIPAAFDEGMQVNAGTPARMAQEFLRCANARGGRRVIQVTDQKLANPNPDFFSYTMSKHALAATVQMLAMSQADPRDRIYGLAPGAILASHDQAEAETEVSHRMNLLGRKTAPEELARAALFLAEGWLATGETLFVDSGQHLLAQSRDVLYLARE